MSTQLVKFLVFCIIAAKCLAQNEQRLVAELELASLELQDDCEYTASMLHTSLTTNTFVDKVKALKARGRLLEMQAANLKHYDDSVSSSVERNWILLTKPGDALLPTQDWDNLVEYNVGLDEIMHIATVNCDKNAQNCLFVKQGYEDMLEKSRNASLLKKSWIAWQSLVSLKRNHYSNILNLIPKAAKRNDFEDVRSYWEMLVEQESSYELADNIWQQIKPLYIKLHKFVKTKLFKFYNTTEETNIPAYLLGSNFGTDWSFVADIVLPYPQLYRDAENFITQLNIQQIYKLAEELAINLSLKPLGSKFWINSRFNFTFCENHLISFCDQEYTELLACPKTTWTSYLDAFEVAIDVALRNEDFLSLPRGNLRFSALDEAVKGLGPVFAVYNMKYKKIWHPELFAQNNVSQDFEIMELLLIALRVLPKLPFYLGADKWRMDLIEHGMDDMELKWWKLRNEMQGVVGVANNETDFLGDSFLISNKPYLGKFLGTIVLFHFLDYFKPEKSEDNFAQNIGSDENFLRMLKERKSTSWLELIGTYFSIYELSATPLLQFFEPLNNYLDSIPENQIFLTMTQKPSTTSSRFIKDEQNDQQLFESTTEISDDNSTQKNQFPVREDLKKANFSVQTISMYVGLALLGLVAFLLFFVVLKRITRRKRTNNRRFET